MAPRARAGFALVVAAGVGTVLALSAAGAGIDGTVTGKAADGNGLYVTVTTDIGGLQFERYLPTPAWTVVQEGDEVVYHVHDGETEIFTWERGDLIWRG